MDLDFLMDNTDTDIVDSPRIWIWLPDIFAVWSATYYFGEILFQTSWLATFPGEPGQMVDWNRYGSILRVQMIYPLVI